MNEQTPRTEVCEGTADEDCDGTVDEGCNCVNGNSTSCYTGPSSTRNTGICHAGTKTCSGGQWSGCMNEQTPQTEMCTDSLDNDCDGETNETCSCNYNGLNAGVCAGLTEDNFGNCPQPANYEEPETSCGDGLDNDCDGNVDGSGTKAGGSSCSNDCACQSGWCHNGTCAHRIFATSNVYDGDLGGISGADSKCNSVASAAGLQGNWRAVISDYSTHARDHVTIAGTVMNMNGQKVADNKSDFWGRCLDAAVGYDESGSSISRWDQAWTGTHSDGRSDDFHDSTPEMCTDSNGNAWEMNGSGDRGESGYINVRCTGRMQNGSDPDCSQTTAHLYCIDGQ